ncbi:unnamed protein product [Psylliodes chrysocephalus]|uniref:Uncharacterized protein n=1 Tax=Psylliodes chrysocephalus TaxID=3402493 RepID=A0A9P0CUX7_9CUCU|nr:unnamed protein product [Psylliodes chrysocephala]
MASTLKGFAIHDMSVMSENSVQGILADSDKSTTKLKKKVLISKEKSKTCSPWTSRNRPLITTPIYSELSAKYAKLADLKKEIATCELEQKKNQKVEFELRRKSLELDLKIKEVHLKKMLSSSNLPNY